MYIHVINHYKDDHKRVPFKYKSIIQDLSTVFPDDEECSLILVDLEEIHRINKNYRHLDRPTDVISFEDKDPYGDPHYKGDIYLCIDKAMSQAQDYGHSVKREFAFLLIHGLLHIHGYDHLNPIDEKIMFDKQDEILGKLGYTR